MDGLITYPKDCMKAQDIRKGSKSGPNGTSRSKVGLTTAFPAFRSLSEMVTSKSSIGYFMGPLGFGFSTGVAPGIGVPT